MSQKRSSQLPGAPGSPAVSGSMAGTGSRPSRRGDRPGQRWTAWVISFFLALAVWAVFGQTRHYEFVNYDDDEQIYKHPVVKNGPSWRGITWVFTHSDDGHWIPLTKISHMLDCQWYGLQPGGHHLTNVVLHAATAILLFLALRNLTGALWRSAFVAAVFAIHPLRAESVAWVAERKDVLSGLFFMLTLFAYTQYARRVTGDECRVSSASASPSRVTRHAPRFYWLGLLFFACGLLSKAMVATLPLLLLLLDYWPLDRFRRTADVAAPDPAKRRAVYRRLILEKIPFLALIVAAGVGLLFTRDKNNAVVAAAWQTGQGLVPHKNLGPNLAARTGDALLTPLVYIKQMFYPVGLSVDPPPSHHVPPGEMWLAAMLLIIISALVLVRRRKQPYLMVGWFWYLVMLTPVLILIQQGAELRCDRYTYLPQIGCYILLAWAAAEGCAGWRHRRLLLGSAAAAILGGLLAGSHVQTGYWKDSRSLWTHALACSPENVLAHNNFGVMLAGQQKWDEAIEQYQRALQFKPDDPQILFNYGVALAGQQKWDEAIDYYNRALRLKPDYAEVHNNLGGALAWQAKPDEARQQFERAIQIKPDYAEAHNNLGLILIMQGNENAARQQFQQALALATAQGNTRLAESIRARLESLPPVSPQTQKP